MMEILGCTAYQESDWSPFSYLLSARGLTVWNCFYNDKLGFLWIHNSLSKIFVWLQALTRFSSFHSDFCLDKKVFDLYRALFCPQIFLQPSYHRMHLFCINAVEAGVIYIFFYFLYIVIFFMSLQCNSV